MIINVSSLGRRTRAHSRGHNVLDGRQKNQGQGLVQQGHQDRARLWRRLGMVLQAGTHAW